MKVQEMMAILNALEAGEDLRLPVILQHDTLEESQKLEELQKFNEKFIETINKIYPPTVELYGWEELANTDSKSFPYMFFNFFSTLFKLQIPHIHLSFQKLDNTKLKELIPTIYDAINKAADELQNPCVTHVTCFMDLKNSDTSEQSDLSQWLSRIIQWNSRRATVSLQSLNNMLVFGQELVHQGELFHGYCIYQDILHYNENFVDAHVNLAYYYHLVGDFNNAIFYLNKAIKLLPNEIEEAGRLSYCYAIKGRMQLNLAKELADYVLAREDLEKAISLDPHRKDAPFWLQECEANLDKLTEISMSALMSGSMFNSSKVDIKTIDHEDKKLGL